MSGASLAGAQFTVTYYDALEVADDGTYDSVPEGIPSEHERQWVFETKDIGGTGVINLTTANYKVSGDDLYFENDSPSAVYPLGTYVIQETKAPDGYQLSDKVWVRTVTQNGDFTAVETFNDLDGDSAVPIGAVPSVLNHNRRSANGAIWHRSAKPSRIPTMSRKDKRFL